MEITFLGTSAHDFSKRLLTDFKDSFDKDARRSSSVMIDGRYLVDCGTHTTESLRIIGKPLCEIEAIFITHQHPDHYDENNIRAIAAARREPLRIYIRDGAEVGRIENVELILMSPFIACSVGEGLTVTGMPANHDGNTHPQHFMIECGGKRLFYGCDGAWLLNETYGFMRRRRFDALILDATVGDYEGDYRMGEHNSIPMIRLMLPSLRSVGIIDGQSAVWLSHIAPSLHAPHERTVEIARAFGADVAYDGLKIEI